MCSTSSGCPGESPSATSSPLVGRLRHTLLELGTGFAFVGQQVHLDVGGDDFYIDLLFVNIPQVRYVVVELRTGKFEPDFARQLGFYIAAVDAHLRDPPSTLRG